MDILYVKGDDDYGASTFEDECGIEKAKKLLEDSDKIQGDGWYGEKKTFKDVDEKFIDFIRSEIQDYDDSKHKNFYVL